VTNLGRASLVTGSVAALLLLVACTHPALPPQDATYTLDACRWQCAPDVYQWTATTVGPTAGGLCACSGRLGP
jgi:chitodextrinase